jgi:ribosomal protein L12E/L44/L45/RPP1/RPP2
VAGKHVSHVSIASAGAGEPPERTSESKDAEGSVDEEEEEEETKAGEHHVTIP